MKKNRKQRFLNLVLSAIMAATPAGASAITVQAVSDETSQPYSDEQTFTLKAGTEAVLTTLFGLDPETEWYFEVLGTGICEIDTRSVDTGDGYTRSVDYLRALTPGRVYVRAEGESERYTFAVVVTPGDTEPDPDSTVEITLKSFETMDLAAYMEETYSQQATMEYDSITASYDPFDGILHALLPGEAWLEERDENGELYYTIHVTVEENPLLVHKTIPDLQPVALSSLAELTEDLSYVQTYGFPDQAFELSDTDQGTMVSPLGVSTGYLVGYDELDTVLFVIELSVANPGDVQTKRMPVYAGGVVLYDQIRAELNSQNLTFQVPASSALSLNADRQRAETSLENLEESLLAAYDQQGTLCALFSLYPVLSNGPKTLDEQKTYSAADLLGFATSQSLKVTSENPAVALAENDTLKTLAKGETKVSVQTDDGKTIASWQVTVNENTDIPAETITVALTQKESLDLNDYFSAEDLKDAVVSYDEQNVTYNRTNGKLTFLTPGEYEVTVTLASGKVHPFKILVAEKVYDYKPAVKGDIYELPEELELTGLNMTVAPEGALREIAHKTYVLCDADEDGHASVVLTDSEGNTVHEQYFAVEEAELPASETISLNPGQTRDLMALLNGAENTRFFVDSDAVSISEQGVLKAEKDGDAVVFAAVNGHLEKEWHVAVHSAEEKTLEGRVGQSKELIFSEEGLNQPVLTSSDSETVRADDLHHITLLKAGTASVRLSTAEGDERIIWLVTVKDPETYTLSGLEGQQIMLNLTEEEAQGTELLSSDSETVRVDDLTHITLLKAGEASLTLKDAQGAVLAIWTVTVQAPEQIALSGLETEEKELNYSEEGITGARLESGNEEIVRVIDLHHIALVKAGETTVVLKDSEGVVHTVWTVSVSAPEEIALNGVEGQRKELTYSEEGIDGPRVESSDEEIARVDDFHHITLVKAGSAQLILKDSNGVVHVIWNVTVTAPVHTTLSGLEGEQKELSYFEEGIEGASLTSADESIARIDDLHHVTLLKAGETTVTLKDSAGVVHAVWTISVEAPAQEALGGLVGEQKEVTFSEEGLQNPALTSSDESIVRVDDLHHVTLLKAGEAKVSLKESNGAVHIIWTVTVSEPETPVTVFEKKANTGTSLDLLADLEDGQKEGVVFTSSDEQTVSVDENGTAHLLKAGSAVVTASQSGKDVAVWNIEVIEPVSLTQTMKTGDTAAPVPAEGVDLSGLSLTSSDPQTVAITENGEFSALKAGTAVIQGVDSEGLIRVIWTVTIKDRPALNEESFTGYENSTADLSAYLGQYEGKDLVYTSSDPETVSADDQGMISLLKPGQAVIAVTLDGDPVLRLTVTVRARGIPGWSEDRQKFVKEDGTYACNEWIEYAGGRYAFDENETVRKGWYTDENGDTYHLNENTGLMTTNRWVSGRWLGADGKEITDPDLAGWITDSYGQKRYMTKDNVQFRNGFLDINGKTYLFGVFGELKTGWNKVNGSNYYSDANGVVQKNCWIDDTYWVEEDGKLAVSKWVDNNRYYVDAQGRKVLNPKPQQWVTDSFGKKWQLEDGSFLKSSWLTVNGKTYYLKSDTYAATGWLGLGGSRYYFDSDGARKTGLISDGGRLYYLDPENEGRMATGWKTIDGYDYYFTSSGASATGWVNRGTARYYYTSEGRPYQGWLKEGDKSYFIHRGKMMTGWLTLNGARFYLGEDGVARKYWVKMDGNWYYFYGSGAMATGWVTQRIGTFYLDPETGIMATGMVEIEGTLCNFDEEGHAAGGWMTKEDGTRYYFNSNGKAYQGWLKEGDKSYFIHRGKMMTGWLTLNGARFYLGEDGVARKYWVKMDGNWYYFYGSGAMATGWVTQRIGTFYLDPETGIMATGMVEIEGTLCNFDEEGHAAGGWMTKEDGTRYYFNSNGKAYQGWLKEGDKSYFIHRGKMMTGWLTLNGARFYLGEDGVARKYWVKMDGNWYYFYGSGALATGWITQRIGTFYLDPETGIMATGMKVIDGTRWFFDGDGKLATGWAEDETGKYYFEGGKPVTGWKDLDGYRYYFLEDGRMAVGQVTIDGTDYWFDENGHLITEEEEQPAPQN